ncbi:MAG: WD40 repeat domain-containing protein [Firmicutes bacterium]|nr:WD40 repeat domain-containing protein [Bacillota bacterium]
MAISGGGSFTAANIAAGPLSTEDSNGLYLYDSRGERLWQHPMGSPYATVLSLVGFVSISADGNYVAAAYPDDSELWLLENAGDSATALWSYRARGKIVGLAMSGDAQYVVAACSEKRVYALDHEGRLLWDWESKERIADISLSPDGRFILVATGDGVVHLLQGPAEDR